MRAIRRLLLLPAALEILRKVPTRMRLRRVGTGSSARTLYGLVARVIHPGWMDAFVMVVCEDRGGVVSFLRVFDLAVDGPRGGGAARTRSIRRCECPLGGQG